MSNFVKAHLLMLSGITLFAVGVNSWRVIFLGAGIYIASVGLALILVELEK